jgi:P4 family phage/plasmid primase-like protien
MPIYLHAKKYNMGCYSKQLTAPTLRELLLHNVEYVGHIPPEDRKDMYYSLAQTQAPRRAMDKDRETRAEWEKWMDSNWERQEVLAFDLDAVKLPSGETIEPLFSRTEDYTEVVAEQLKCPAHELTVIRSGHGLHFLAFLATPITSWRFFKKHKTYYTTLVDQMQAALDKAKLPGSFDKSVFEYARVFRLPATENHKVAHLPTQCEIHQLSLVTHPIHLPTLLGLPEPQAEETLSIAEARGYLKQVDKEGVLSLCNFLKYTRERGSEVKEPEGYAALSILARLDSDQSTARDYYQGWTGSRSLSGTDPTVKIEHALQAAGPRTCDSIAALRPDLCAGCQVRCKSPLLIRRETFLPSEAQGFYTIVVDPETGVSKKGKPHYDDLLKAYRRDHHYFYQVKGKLFWAYTGTHYAPQDDQEVKAYSERVMQPKPMEAQRAEFLSKLRANYQRGSDSLHEFFVESTKTKVNFKNGVLNTETGELSPHSHELGFKYVLPYDYDPMAQAPRFEQFLREITLGRGDLQATILDCLGALFVPGYAGIDAGFWVFRGGGRNGKSTLLKVITKLVGSSNAIEFTAGDFSKDRARFRLAELEGKLVCFLEEVAEKTFPMGLLGIVKGLSAGGTFTVERKGKDPYQMTNAAKLIFTANNDFILEDVSPAVQERFVYIPFELNLADPDCPVVRDPELEKKLYQELPGIFNLALNARAALLQRGKPYMPKLSREHVRELVLDSDSFERWFSERVERDPESVCYFKDLYADYRAFEENFQAKSDHKIAKLLRAKIGRAEPFRTGRVGGGAPGKLVDGLRLIAPSPY